MRYQSKIVGFGVIELGDHKTKTGCTPIIAIDPSFQSKGLFSTYLRVAEEYAKS